MEVFCWEKDHLLLLDQSKLPLEVDYIACCSHHDVAEAIREMRVRGAPAIGVAAAFGIALAAFKYSPESKDSLEDFLFEAAKVLKETRPTAVNLVWALERMLEVYQKRLKEKPLDEVRTGLLEAARQILADQKARDDKIASFGATLIPEKANILTYCNTGALATGGLGTALGVIVRAHEEGKRVHVYVPETRPVLQGARLTVWELREKGIPFTLITDNMAGYLFSRGEIDLVIVGADRIAANGDFANKIGTYSLAVLAFHHQRPFYVAAPVSTFDLGIASGEDIPIEMRNPDEVRMIQGTPITDSQCPVLNPAFDVTPHELVSGFITEKGVIKPPFESLASFLENPF
ncbi:MAG TPA: S-methyl-5-thioribose-1-phosphate isomerase [Peptococcaceae bacterium]|nr:S-methyl-5-thioribose-1-phosphate isomerase [Peptococcaceae bacterium]